MNPVNGTATRGQNLLRAHKHGFARGYLGYEMHPPRGWQKFSPTEFEAFASGYKCGQREATLDKQRLEAFHRDRPSRAAGFTLMEVLVVLAILGILAGIALPSYGHHLLRASVHDAVRWSEPLQAVVIENHQAGEPLDTGFAPVSHPMKRIENVAIDPATGTITLTLQAGTVEVTPTSDLSGAVVGWTCTGGTLSENFRPAACRGGA